MTPKHLNLNDLDPYISFVENLADEQSSQIFNNSGTDQAVIVLGNIFRKSQNILRIYSGEMNKEVTDQEYFFKNFRDFIRRGGEVKVLLQKEVGTHPSETLRYLISESKLRPDKISIRTCPGSYFYVDDNPGSEVHFTVGDERAFRVETDPVSRKAKCSFNSTESAKNMINSYEEGFKNATPV